MIGMNLWLAPQISEHWPKNNPARFNKNLIWFNRPGLASILTLKAGIVHEWITSAAVTIIRICELNGNTVRLSTSSNRKFEGFISSIGIIYESNSKFLKSEYSYDQYHWCPIVLIEINGLLISSSKYNNRRDGNAIKINVIAGIIVQIISIVWPSNRYRKLNWFLNIDIIKYLTITVIINKINNVWSWKNANCSVNGEALSWSEYIFQVAFSKKS